MKTRVKKSIIWKISKELLQSYYDNSSSIGQILLLLGMMNKGSNFRTLKQRMISDNISLEKFNENKSKIIRKNATSSVPLQTYLVQESSYSRCSLKRRIIKEGILDYECRVCNLGPVWNGQKLSLQLEHINGISNDNRIENLCFLCPNCHSQTTTFAGRNK